MNITTSPRIRRTVSLASGVALLLAACGGSDAAEQPAVTDPPVEEVAALASTGDSGLGQILVNADGLTLYGFTNDTDGQPTCNDACADAWPPIVVDGDTLPAGLDPAIFSVVTRDDGSSQLAAGVWPLYLFAGDGTPGDTNGQGSGDVWFAATPDGGLIKGDAQSIVSPAADDDADVGGYDY